MPHLSASIQGWPQTAATAGCRKLSWAGLGRWFGINSYK
jgi:hypothetical protein